MGGRRMPIAPGWRRGLIGGLVCLLLLSAQATAARRVLETPEQFIRQGFPGRHPAIGALWIDADLRADLEAILQHRYRRRRVRYWHDGGRLAWILDEVGKKRPITVGVIVESGRIRRLAILVYRETRGWEIESPGFTRQFSGAGLSGDRDLDRPIDGITGATLSVRAVEKIARIALRLSREVDGP